MRALAVFLLLIFSMQRAAAGDWRYCLAPSHEAGKVYLSLPFPVSLAAGDPESEFGRMLERSGRPHDDVQCPRANDESAALVMQQQAIDYNRQAGNKVVRLNWAP